MKTSNKINKHEHRVSTVTAHSRDERKGSSVSLTSHQNRSFHSRVSQGINRREKERKKRPVVKPSDARVSSSSESL